MCNKKIARVFTILFIVLISNIRNAKAWGPEGHALVGRLAMRLVKDDVRQNLMRILDKMPIDTAANWMDIMKSNPDYDFMRSWHYIDFAKNSAYTVSNNDNIINRLILTYNELSHKQILCDQQMKTDLFVLLHLMGDLHMPLHTGYDDDLGGNKVIVQYDTIKTHNLHTFWDVDIITLTKITDTDCLKHYNTSIADTFKTIDFTAWMLDSRSLLGDVYNFPDYTLSKDYLYKNKIVVEKQLLKAGMRLALILNKLFAPSSVAMNFKTITAKYRNGIYIGDVSKNIGKYITLCEMVHGIRANSAITQLFLGAQFPNNLISIVVFNKNYAKFSLPIEEMYKDKNICVKGKIEQYKSKLQIIVEKPEDIIIQ